ncbi:hypothetical protein [Actinoplanes sp. NPDC051851]|uniref:hypothetical protein n=1 Tax=Actinoplanes sp. NPDC051851 TaxID=3154753 RepID=UPI00342263CF
MTARRRGQSGSTNHCQPRANDDLFSFIAIPLSQLATGPLAAVLGAGRLAVLCGVVYLIAALLPLLSRETRQG